MLLETIDTVNTNIVSNIATKLGSTLYYGGGSLKELEEYFLVDDSRFPIIWWIKEEGANVKTSAPIAGSYTAYDQHNLSYVLHYGIDIDNPDRKGSLEAADRIVSLFEYEWRNYQLDYGNTNVTGVSVFPQYHKTNNAMVGMAFSLTVQAPNDSNYCG